MNLTDTIKTAKEQAEKARNCGNIEFADCLEQLANWLAESSKFSIVGFLLAIDSALTLPDHIREMVEDDLKAGRYKEVINFIRTYDNEKHN